MQYKMHVKFYFHDNIILTVYVIVIANNTLLLFVTKNKEMH